MTNLRTHPRRRLPPFSLSCPFRLFQDIVKGAFMDVPFREKVKLGAVNSINWARVLAQMTYYFYAYYQVRRKGP